tara:strand:+ start:1153 stop:2283 length:1131 start_codon:yes stop_codon:yes gene_type:complete
MKTILYLGLIQAIFAGILIFNQKRKKNHHVILGIWLFILAIHFISDLLFKYGVNSLFSTFHLIIFPFLQGPFIYLYTVFTINGDKRFSKKNLFHLIPFLTFAFIFIILKDKPIFEPNLMGGKLDEIPFIEYVYGFSIYIINIVYAILTHNLLNRNRSEIKNIYSSESNKIKLTWVRTIVYISIFFILSFYALATVDYVWLNTGFDFDFFLNIGLTGVVFIISFYGFRQPTVFRSASLEVNNIEPEEKTSYKRSGLKPEQAQEYIENINDFMVKEKPYLETEFSIYALSESLNISQYYITQSLNETLGKNFYTYVNEFRVKEAKQRLLDPKNDHLTVLGIGFESGFNSKSTFYSIFKKYTGKSPSEYKKEFDNQLLT